LAARRVDRLDAASSKCSNPAFAVRCDVRDEQSCANAVEQAAAAMGGLDSLVYASGAMRFAELGQASLADWHTVLHTNLVGAGLITRFALPHLDAAAGRAVYLSSTTAGLSPPLRGFSLYTISKLGLEQMVRCLQHENTRVDFTAIVLGPTATDFATDVLPDITEPVMSEWSASGYFSGDLLEAQVPASVILDVLAGSGRIEAITIAPSPARTKIRRVPRAGVAG
jgi:NAD(P)-dependent dehydrogenase (short-subunit alcohol dehydrogenase family)